MPGRSLAAPAAPAARTSQLAAPAASVVVTVAMARLLGPELGGVGVLALADHVHVAVRPLRLLAPDRRVIVGAPLAAPERRWRAQPGTRPGATGARPYPPRL